MLGRIKNWREFQHYKDRNPPWIKLHWSILASEDWVSGDDRTRVLAIACLLLASRTDGEIDLSERGIRYIQRVAYLNSRPDFKPLIDSGFLELQADASGAQAEFRPETETETEEEREEEKRVTDVTLVEQRDETSRDSTTRIPVKRIIDHLNEVAGTRFRHNTEATRRHVQARFREGFTLADFIAVIDHKARDWGGDPEMTKYLRPQTLFGTKFESYLQESNRPSANDRSWLEP